MNERRHCDRCGGPIRYDESAPAPGWLHVDQSDDMTCPLGDQFLLIRPAPPTRDEITAAITQSMADTEGRFVGTAAGVRQERYRVAADAVLALFGVAVSDSQPVRPTRDQIAEVIANDPNAKWCSHHQCLHVEYKPGWWDCPLASLEDLTDHFQRLYETVYAPAPAGEDGIYHRAREIVDAIRGVAVSDSQETPE